MLCQNCGKNEATMYFRQTVNGQTKEMTSVPGMCRSAGRKQSVRPKFPFQFRKTVRFVV